MAGKAGLRDHPKFKRLVYKLKEPVPHVMGYLECLWITAYQRRDDLIGDDVDVELNAEFPGEPGKLVSALLECGFIDEVEGKFFVHNLIDHCPQYVKKGLVKHQNARSLLKQSTNLGNKSDENSVNGLSSCTQEKREERREKREERREESPAASSEEIKSIAVDLAQKFWFKQTKGKEDEFKLADGIESMLVFGYSASDILAEINKPPTERNYAERFFKIEDRLEKLRARGPTVTRTKSAAEHAADAKAQREAIDRRMS